MCLIFVLFDKYENVLTMKISRIMIVRTDIVYDNPGAQVSVTKEVGHHVDGISLTLWMMCLWVWKD